MADGVIPSQQSADTLLGLHPKETSASSKFIKRNWSEEIKNQALFSARTTSRTYLDMVREQLAAVADRGVIPLVAEKKLRDTLTHLGYSPETGFPDKFGRVPPAKPGAITDLSSSRRIQLIIDTNVKQARSMGQIASSENPVQLMAVPAWKLTRTGARKKPRGDWKARWTAAGQSVGWRGAAKTIMVALKTSPIWEALGKGVGGFQDTLASSFPPFAFGSGMAWVGVGRREWKRLCEKEGIPDGLEDITNRARQLKAAQEAAGGEGSWGVEAGARPEGGWLGDSPRKTEIPPVKPPLVPAPPPFQPDTTARQKAEKAVSDANKTATEAGVECAKLLADIASSETDAHNFAAAWPEADVKAAMDRFTAYKDAVEKKAAEIKALVERLGKYSESVEKLAAPANQGEQGPYNAAHDRVASAAGKVAESARAAYSAAKMQADAARKNVAEVTRLIEDWKKAKCAEILAEADKYLAENKIAVTSEGDEVIHELQAKRSAAIAEAKKLYGKRTKTEEKSAPEKAWITQNGQLSNIRGSTAASYDALKRACACGELKTVKGLYKDVVENGEHQKTIYARLAATVELLVQFILTPPADAPAATPTVQPILPVGNTPPPLVHDPTKFPTELTQKDIAAGRDAGEGSTGARFVTVNGKQYVCKRPSAVTGRGQVTEECLKS